MLTSRGLRTVRKVLRTRPVQNNVVGAQRRGLAFSERAVELLKDQVRKVAEERLDDELAQDTWMSYTSVDDPTVSVADPITPEHMKGSMFDFRVDLNRRARGHEHIDLRTAPDPFELVGTEIASISDSIKNLLGSDHPVLARVANVFVPVRYAIDPVHHISFRLYLLLTYFFEADGGKKIRPTMVLLMARAINSHALQSQVTPCPFPEFVLASQKRLAEITEIIHTASLLHDDVIDGADTRRGMSSVNSVFGNKLAILAGDFLLSRASVSLARLRNYEAVEILSIVIEHLVKGEVMQMRSGNGSRLLSPMEYYLRKNYYKTGSLMANSCRAVGVVAGHSTEVCDLAFAYGKHIGLAFQLIDDCLDFEGSLASLGKPALADLKQGLATAPVLFAQEEYPELDKMISRKFSEDGDVEAAARLVQKSQGLQRSKELAASQAELACDAMMHLKPSKERDALVKLAYKVINRSK